MLRIGILDSASPGRIADRYWYPVYLNAQRLKSFGLRFSSIHSLKRASRFDVLFLSSRFFHLEGKKTDEKRRILDSLEELRKAGKRVIWFDVRDSTGNTQFEVLPVVDLYLKKQLYREHGNYRRKLYGNRLFTDYFHQKFNVNDSYQEEYQLLDQDNEHKLGISWNLGLTDFIPRSYFKLLVKIFADLGAEHLPGKHTMSWTPYASERKIHMTALFNTGYDRDTVAFQRKRAMEILSEYEGENILFNTRLSPAKFYRSLSHSRIVLSLFGWGEVCYRDFETMMAGAALLMPDMTHLTTWPDYYLPRETYWPMKWDLSDFMESYERLLGDDGLRLELARRAQENYMFYWSEEGKELFCERLREIITETP